ncbi:glycine cleavage system protein H [Pseudomonas sp. RL]|uniref:glycine cleavage system protein H n=1 Tax=Pseudomonas sp. RL TaxID=1452718 RepID=UPI00048138B8|nr:glycine cleavage system protein H [Pseudomonas sp. RL]
MNIQGLEFPDDFQYAPALGLWLREEADGQLTLGLNAYGCALYGEIFAFTPKRLGARIEEGRSFGVLEFAKAATSSRSPLSGELSAINEALEQRPALIHRDCYGVGWLVRLRPEDWPAQRQRFPQGEAARAALEAQMRLDGFNPDNPAVQALKWKK